MQHKILITGASGLIGTAVSRCCLASSLEVRHLDVRGIGHAYGDIRDPAAVPKAIHSCDGIIHLAAVSRVSWAERAPERCNSINIGGTRVVLDAALASPKRPWVILASSREVYGDVPAGLATEDTPLRPKNVYGRSKLAAEQALQDAMDRGLSGAIVRLANVYGSPDDHHDRVIPAFVRAALTGRPLRVDGPDRAFDFTHVDDVAATLHALPLRLLSGVSLAQTVHLTTGVGVTLRQLANRVVTATQSRSLITFQPHQAYDVSSFVGCPRQAGRVLGWAPKIDLDVGIARLADDLRRLGFRADSQEILP